MGKRLQPRRFPRLEVPLNTLRLGQKFGLCLVLGREIRGEVIYITRGSVYVEIDNGKKEHWSLGSLVYPYPVTDKFTKREMENMNMRKEDEKRKAWKNIRRFPRPFRFPRLKKGEKL
jgi:hypothetical protein